MPFNIFDLDNVQMNATRRSKAMVDKIVRRFHQPEAESDIGELVHNIQRDPGVSQYLQRALPKQMREMEVRYGKD